MLERMVAELDELGGQAEAAELRAEVAERRALYAKEVEAIRAAQAEGPDAAEAQHLLAWVRFANVQYRLHFAGQGRSTRDLGRLTEIVERLERLDRELAELGKRHAPELIGRSRDELAQSLSMYRDERSAIAVARGEGTLAEQADLLARLANDQFSVYRTHFAGKKRLSRRPALLVRVVDSLEQVLDRMSALQQQGHHDERNERNLSIVQERLGFYRKELEEVRRARQETGIAELVGALGDAAEEVYASWQEHFAGQARATRDVELLSSMFDGLYDLALQMDDLDRVRDDATNQRNLGRAMDELRLYDREEVLIREAKAEAAH